MTPDSLYASRLQKSGGEQDLRQHLKLTINAGADILDIGGESTGPGSQDISANEEWARIEPALKLAQELKQKLNFKVSVDTYKSDVLAKALNFGIDMLNDVSGLRGSKGMAQLVAGSKIDVCIMYAAVALQANGNKTRTNNNLLRYDDVIKTIGDFWQQRIAYALLNGIAESQIVLDPGMGAFVSGDPKYSFEILERLRELKQRFSQYRILVGASRKGFLSKGGKLSVGERLEPSLAAAKLAAKNGADIIRTHDVAETKAIL